MVAHVPFNQRQAIGHGIQAFLAPCLDQLIAQFKRLLQAQLNGFDITTPQADGADFDPGNGKLRIIGTSANDSAVVNLGSGGQVRFPSMDKLTISTGRPFARLFLLAKREPTFFATTQTFRFEHMGTMETTHSLEALLGIV